MPTKLHLAAVLLWSGLSGTALAATTVDHVVDGDTIRIPGESVRIIGIDTPEMHPEQCFAQAATRQLQALLSGATVQLYAQPNADRDKYHRLLRYVHADGRDVGAALLRTGYARSYKYFSHPRRSAYNRLEQQAKTAGLGLWTLCSPGSGFTDVPPNHPQVQAIRWAKAHDIVQGYANGTFKPDQPVTRAAFLKILLGGQGRDVPTTGAATGFTDVDANAWYAPYVRYAKSNGLVQGYADGSFKPNRPITVQEMRSIVPGEEVHGVSRAEVVGLVFGLGE